MVYLTVISSSNSITTYEEQTAKDHMLYDTKGLRCMQDRQQQCAGPSRSYVGWPPGRGAHTGEGAMKDYEELGNNPFLEALISSPLQIAYR
jgi:hypothetical protein